MDETIVGAEPARWTTAGMKREDEMQGSRSEGMDERGRSLVMDGGIGVSAPTWWRRTAVDGVAGGGGWGAVAILGTGMGAVFIELLPVKLGMGK